MWSGVFSRSLSFKGDSDSAALSVLYGLMCNFVAVCLTSVQFILQLNLCLYTIVHLLLEEFKISLKSSLSTQSLCHTVSLTVGVRV